jgi:YVTN family beta-propeller protein
MRMFRPQAFRLVLCLGLIAAASWLFGVRADGPKQAGLKYPSPVALALSGDGSRLLVANQGTGTVALIDPKAAKVLAEVPTGDRPAGIAISKDGRRAVVSHWFGYDAAILEVGADSLKVVGRVEIGPEPRGVVISPDAKRAYVTVGVGNEVVRLDLDSAKVTGRLTVGREPRGIAITPDGLTLVVANARSRDVSVIDTAKWVVSRTVDVDADNLRQITIGPDGKTVYAANMRNRRFPTTRNNIDVGWVLGQRVTKLWLDDSSGDYATLSLDPEGKAAADAHGVAISADGQTLAVSSGGTHEILLFREAEQPLPWRVNGSRDLIASELLKKDGRFRRVSVGGRPTELVFAPDGKTIYTANYLTDSVDVIDAESATLTKTIKLEGPADLSLVRRGEVVFHDATKSFNQWYSCNTCHSDGHTGGMDFDTLNDGWHDFNSAHKRSRKKVPTLRGVAKTGPWTWHGWQTSLEDAIVESFTKSMQGPKPKAEEVEALVAYLETLDFPKNPYRQPDGSLTESAKRGETVFKSSKAACNTCHGGPEFTDGKIHKVGLEERGDVYKGYNPPSLKGVYDKDPYLHDGRAKTLRDGLTRGHDPESVTGLGSLSDSELDDLIAYLKSL